MERAKVEILKLPTPTHGALHYAERRKRVYCERLMWPCLEYHGFRSQVAFGPYIADFLSLRHRLCIELDGKTHPGREEADRVRDEFFASNGFRVLRIKNELMKRDIEQAMALVMAAMGLESPEDDAVATMREIEAREHKKRSKRARRAAIRQARRRRRSR